MRSCPIFVALLVFAPTATASPTTQALVADRLAHHLAPHPRLLITEAGLADLQRQISGNPRLTALRSRLLAEADGVLNLPALERKLTGRRLLFVSREALSRIATLSLAYRLTRDARYAEAARANLLAVAGFSDFHPEHFLDVAEMTAALAIGYDWLFDALPPPDRDAIRSALIDKALKVPLTRQNWVRATSNWNQVCHGGLALGAFAIADEAPALAATVVGRAVECVPLAMHSYAPDGVHPEGPNYWEYGTQYNTLLIAALDSALRDDFGLSAEPGYLPSADFHLHTVGPTGLWFDYSDSPVRPDGPSPTAFYLAHCRGEPSLLHDELRLLDERLIRPISTEPNADWLLLTWARPPAHAPTPTTRSFVGDGPTPIAVFRSGWDADATFLAFKAGSPSTSHGHMDIGEFILDAAGQRWAADLGMQDYNSLESRGVDLWNGKPDSQRWQVFRIGPKSHNILTIDGQPQRVDGHAGWIRSGSNFAIADLTPVYAGQLAAVRRGVVLRANRSVRVQDEFTAPPDRSAVVEFGLTTPASAEIADHAVRLSQNGKAMRLRFASPMPLQLAAAPADPPPHDYDALNPGMNRVTARLTVPAGQSSWLTVDFIPDDREPQTPLAPMTPSDQW